VRLSSVDYRQLYIPAGFAHGFQVVSDSALVVYKCTAYYRPEHEITIAWDDPDLGIEWPGCAPLLSAKDRHGRRLRALTRAELPEYG
jgi:dTDP-4-dehydrorhamnose 3,5-epimerase